VAFRPRLTAGLVFTCGSLALMTLRSRFFVENLFLKLLYLFT
jgi:hypothetical protein